jgi:hypothetical protein
LPPTHGTPLAASRRTRGLLTPQRAASLVRNSQFPDTHSRLTDAQRAASLAGTRKFPDAHSQLSWRATRGFSLTRNRASLRLAPHRQHESHWAKAARCHP